MSCALWCDVQFKCFIVDYNVILFLVHSVTALIRTRTLVGQVVTMAAIPTTSNTFLKVISNRINDICNTFLTGHYSQGSTGIYRVLRNRKDPRGKSVMVGAMVFRVPRPCPVASFIGRCLSSLAALQPAKRGPTRRKRRVPLQPPIPRRLPYRIRPTNPNLRSAVKFKWPLWKFTTSKRLSTGQ